MEEEIQEMGSFEMRMRKKPRNHLNLNENNVEFLCRTGIGKKVREGAHQRLHMEIDKSTLVNNSFQLGHWKGTVAEKIMYENMGYKGRGLGRNEQGMLTPIEVKVYTKNAGLGSVDEPSVMNQSQPSVIQPNQSQNQNKVRNQKRKHYSDCTQRTKEEKKNRVTVEEFLEKKNQVHVLDVVYDMRGKQVKILTSLENINDEEESIPMAELKHNVRLLVSLCEVDILKIHQGLKIEREIIVALGKEKEELEHDAARQDKQLYSMSEIANELERLSSQCRLGLLTLESLAKSFGDMQKVFPEEYELFGLSTIACSFALDLFHRLFLGWDPLVKPEDNLHLSVVSIWKDLLQDDEIYSRLLMEVVFPVVRKSITNTWQPKHAEPLLLFLDSWEELIPQLVLQTILDHVVMPKLSDAVELWDPRQDTIAIHDWVHPWLVLLGHKLEVLYPSIRTKLEHVLRDWHPSDASAYTVLSPWKDVFNRGTWEQMMISCVAPKLLVVMGELEINPADQKLEHFDWVQTWAGLIPITHMLHIMDVFFDKWQMALYQWLCSNPNYQEINDWFVGWRNLIPSELLSTERVRCQLKVGLDMINQAVEGLEVVKPGPRENLSDINARNQSQFLAQKKASAAQAAQTGMNDLSLKEVIEVHAQDNGLLFKPKPGRMQDGHQVYAFGNISIIIDTLNQKVFAQIKEAWSSVTLEKLVMLGKTAAIKRS